MKRCNKKGNKGVFGDAPKIAYTYNERLEKIFNRKYSVLIPDGLDGYIAKVFLRRGHSVDMYEENKLFLEGGKIDNFTTNGFYNIVNDEELNDFVKVIESNFYKQRINKQYDFVFCHESLHLNNNKDILMKTKIRKLLSSVKNDGYIYISYYLAKDNEDNITYPKEQYLRPFEMKQYFDTNNWDIIYSFEGRTKEHGSHPGDNSKHSHIVGSIFVKRKNLRKKLNYRYTYNIKNLLLN